MANNVKLKPNVYMTITPSVVSQSTSNNTSLIRVIVNLKNPYGTYRYAGRGASYRIKYVIKNGSATLYDSGFHDFDYNIGSLNVINSTFTIAHNSNGTPVSNAFSVTVYGAASNPLATTGGHTADTTLAIATIPRYTSISNFKSTGVTRNSLSFSFSAANTFDQWQYSLSGGNWTGGQTGDRTSATGSIGSRSAGTTYTLKVRVKRKDSQLWTESSTISITTEAIASPHTPTISSPGRDRFTINVTANKSFNGFQYNINGGAWSGKQSGTSVVVTGRAANTSYSVRVRVYDGVHTSSISGQSAATTATTLAAATPNTPTLSSKTAIQQVINWSAKDTVTNVQYKRWYSDSWQSAGADFGAKTSGSIPITGLSPGTTYTFYVRVKDAVHGTWSGASGALTSATYALSTATASNTTLNTSGKSFTISKAVSSMSQDVVLQFWHDNQSWVDLRSWNSTNGGGYTLTQTQIDTVLLGRIDSNTTSFRFKVTSRWGNGGIIQGVTYSPSYTWTFVNVNPTLSGATYKDVLANPEFILWKGGDQIILRNVSQLQIILGAANAIKGAKLSKYVLTVAGKSFTVNATSGVTEQTGAIINAGSLDAGTNQTATIEVFDTRGNKATRAITVQIMDWAEPQIIHGTGERLNSYEKPTNLNLLARYSRVLVGGTDKNSLTAEYRIKVKGSSDSTYSGFVDIITPKGSVNGIWQEVSSTQFMQNLDENTTYTMHIRFKDYVVGWKNYYVDIGMGVGLMEFFEDRVELGVDLYDKNSAKKYMLEGSTRIPESSDINDYSTPGMYYNPSNAQVATMSNTPSDQAFSLLVERHAGVSQTWKNYHIAASTPIYQRNYYNGTWGPWRTIHHSGETSVLLRVYPVGSIYISTTATNPSSLFGGTWVAFATGRTLVGINTGDTDFNTSQKTGGSKTHTHTVGSGIARVRMDKSGIDYVSAVSGTVTNYNRRKTISGSDVPQSNEPYSEGIRVDSGSVTSASSLQPYITVYMWRRTA